MSNAVKTNKRILALDILRGVTIAGMIVVLMLLVSQIRELFDLVRSVFGV